MAQTEFDIEEQRRHMLEETPPHHEMVDGGLVDPKLAGKEIPVPPKWVRTRVNLPDGCEWACLSPKLENYYPPQVRQVLVDYVKRWNPEGRQYGASLLLTGLVRLRERNWAAAAVMNEIVMRFGVFEAISTAFINPGTMVKLMTMRAEHDAGFRQFWARLENARVLMVIDPARIREVDKIHFEVLYEHRLMHRLATITQLSSVIENDDWRNVEREVGKFVTECLQDTHRGFIARY